MSEGLNKTVDDQLGRMVDSFGKRKTLELLSKQAGFISVPPTIQEFVTKPEYLGNAFTMFPTWKRALAQVYPTPFFSPYLEIGLQGAIGLGKTTVALSGTLYDAYRLLLMEDPQGYCQIAKVTSLAFALINANMSLSKGVLGNQLDQFVEESKVLNELRSKSKKSRYSEFFPKKVDFVQGSRFTHVLGRAVVGAILSELNFQTAVKDQAYENYTNARTRLNSRFQKVYRRKGFYPGRIWIDTSKNDANSFVEKHFEDNRDNPLIKIFDYPFWEVHKACKEYKDGFKYSGKTFKVFAGSAVRDPFILNHAADIIGIPEELVLDVPVEHEQDFLNNLPRSLRDIAGRGTWSTSKLIPKVESIEMALDFPNPVTMETIILDFHDQTQKLIDYIEFKKIESDDRPRFIHIDLGLTKDACAVAATRLDGFTEIKRLNPDTRKVEGIKMPIFKTEWILRIKSTPGSEVPIWKLKELIFNLRSRGISIAQLSTDGYQSRNLRQDLTRDGFETIELSTDRTKDPYNYLKDCILETRWYGPRHPVLARELRELVDDGKKFDHPSDGSKDVSDAVAGSLYSALKGMDAFRATFKMQDYMTAIESMSSEQSIYNKIAYGSR